jgi:hypothetical protein
MDVRHPTLKYVSAYLQAFKAKMAVWGVLFRDDRGKNTMALLELGLTPAGRKEVLMSLVPEDYCKGPRKEVLYGGQDMWEFGRTVQNQEVYIKITEGLEGAQVLCISFHPAERPMVYPLKSSK